MGFGPTLAWRPRSRPARRAWSSARRCCESRRSPPDWWRNTARYRIVAALDVRDGKAVGEAWREGAEGHGVGRALERLRTAGVHIFAVTAIARDGLLEGPDLDLLEKVRSAAPDIHLIASGGVGTLDDLRALKALGADAAILGRALYEGRIDLREAIAAAS